MLSRTYAGVSGGREESMATYRVQIIDKPCQIIALKVWYTLLKLFPIKHLAELTVELG